MMSRAEVAIRVASIEKSARENPPCVPELQDLAEVKGKLDLIIDILKEEVIKR